MKNFEEFTITFTKILHGLLQKLLVQFLQFLFKTTWEIAARISSDLFLIFIAFSGNLPSIPS